MKQIQITPEQFFKMTSTEMMDIKKQWSTQASENGYFEQMITIVTTLGNRISFPRRESYQAWYWVVPHPTVKGMFVKATFYQHVLKYNIYGHDPIPANNYIWEKVLLVFIDKEINLWCSGVKVMGWGNLYSPDTNTWIPGPWFDVSTNALREAYKIINQIKDQEEADRKGELSKVFEAFGKF